MKIENNKGIRTKIKENTSILIPNVKCRVLLFNQTLSHKFINPNLRLLKHKITGVTQTSSFRRNKILLYHPLTKFIRYLQNFYKSSLDINKPLYFINFLNI